MEIYIDYMFLFIEFGVWLKLEEKTYNLRYIKVGLKHGLDRGEPVDIQYFACSRSGM